MVRGTSKHTLTRLFNKIKAYGIDAISEQLKREMPGLRGFSAQSIRNMRTFAEFWSQYIKCSPVASEIEVDTFAFAKWSPLTTEIQRDDFLGISFSHHMEILHKTKDIQQVLYIIHQTVHHMWSKRQLREAIPALLKADMAKVVSGSVAKDSDCRICDLRAEFDTQIILSSAVIFVVGDKTASRTAGNYFVSLYP